MPDLSPSTLTVLNSNFLQLGRRSGGRLQRTVYPRRLPVNCDTHYVSGRRTHNLPIVSPTRYQLCHRDQVGGTTGSVTFVYCKYHTIILTDYRLWRRLYYACVLTVPRHQIGKPFRITTPLVDWIWSSVKNTCKSNLTGHLFCFVTCLMIWHMVS